jgi:hypothetical protein
MLDLRLLLLETPEDRYEPSFAIRAAERAVYPLLRKARARPVAHAELLPV